MMTFLERWGGRATSLATFGDSITEAAHIPNPEDRWANRLARALGAKLDNRGRSGTVMQSSPDASGNPRADNGHERYTRDLLGPDRAEVIAILYGTNDARYTAAPATLNHDGFVRDYRDMLAGIFAAGYAPDAIVLGGPPYLPDAGLAVSVTEGFAGQSRAEFQRHVRAIELIARDAGTYYAPVNERMGAEGADALISPDHVHPNESGHSKIAEIFAAATPATDRFLK